MSYSRRTVVVVAVACGLFVLALLPCAHSVRDGEGWVRSANGIHQIGLALRSYHEVHGRLPPAVVRGKDGRPLYSWRVLLLPYLEQDPLYKQFRLDEPWDSPHNLPLSREAGAWVYTTRDGHDDPGLTRYQVLVGPGTAFERDGLTWADFPDGLAGTLLVVEAGDPVVWSRPADLGYDPAGPMPALGAGYTRPVKLFCYQLWREPGFLACTADGKSHFIPHAAGEAAIRGLISRDGGEPVRVSRFE